MTRSNEEHYFKPHGTITPSALDWNPQSIRELERKSIRDFVERNKQYLTGRVLDFGAGKPGTCRQPQPYRDLVSGEYVPVDKGDSIPNVEFDAILCTQVLQYVEDVPHQVFDFSNRLRFGGKLVMTYPTNWDEVEPSDLHRFTKAGMEALLTRSEFFAGFTIISHERRAEIDLGGFKFPLGYGVVAQR